MRGFVEGVVEDAWGGELAVTVFYLELVCFLFIVREIILRNFIYFVDFAISLLQ